jgi:enoyl-CoA hydratase/carnithine racemase
MIDVIEHDSVRELRFARPPANALSPDLLAELCRLLATAPHDGVDGVVMSGRDGLFTGGLDVPVLLELDRPAMAETLELFFGCMELLAASAVPVAAAITGHSPAGGAVLSLFCDWRVMARGSFAIGLNEVRVGIPMPAVIAAALARLVGPRHAEHLCQSGRLLTPEEALAVGLVDRVVEPEQVVPDAVEWCRELADLPGHAFRATRRTVRRDLVEIVRRDRGEDTGRLLDEWFRPEVQAPLRALAEQLKGG